MRRWLLLAFASCYDPVLSEGDGPSEDADGDATALGGDTRALDSPGATYLCDAPEDCPGQECCVTSLPGGGSACQDACPSGTAEVCIDRDDCDCETCDSCGDDPDSKVPNYALPVCYDN